MERVSLLWDYTNHDGGAKHVLIDEVVKNLDLECLSDTIGKNDAEKKDILSILTQITNDVNTIRYRSDIFDELRGDKLLRKELEEILNELYVLREFNGIHTLNVESSSIWQLIDRLKELYAYIECIDSFYHCFNTREFHSKGLCLLKDEIAKLYQGSGFSYLKQDIERLTEDIAQIKSLTLGVNLDDNLNPREVILVSFNRTIFKEKDNGVLSKFIAFMKEPGLANSLLKSDDRDYDPIMQTLTKRVEQLLSTVVKDMKRSLSKYVDISGYTITQLVPELTFYLRYAALCEELESRGLPMCKADCLEKENKQYMNLGLKGFYNIRLAIEENSNAESMTLNDFIFDQLHREYILTGPNRGGKTIFTQGIGLLYVLAQSGVHVPAKEMKFTPVDQIWTHFPADENDTVSLGRLGEEAGRLRAIIEHVTENSLVLMNESLSTTNYTEGLYIAKDIMKVLNYIGSLVVYNTHMHELAASLESIEVSNKYKIISLVMGIEEGKRSYKAMIAPPTGNSYAMDIARKYGILYEQLMETIEKNDKKVI